MISLIFAFTFGNLTALEQCQLLYDRCVVAVAEQQATYNGCRLKRNIKNKTVTPLNVIEAINFKDSITCDAHLAACGYSNLAWWQEANKCIRGK